MSYDNKDILPSEPMDIEALKRATELAYQRYESGKVKRVNRAERRQMNKQPLQIGSYKRR